MGMAMGSAHALPSLIVSPAPGRGGPRGCELPWPHPQGALRSPALCCRAGTACRWLVGLVVRMAGGAKGRRGGGKGQFSRARAQTGYGRPGPVGLQSVPVALCGRRQACRRPSGAEAEAEAEAAGGRKMLQSSRPVKRNYPLAFGRLAGPAGKLLTGRGPRQQRRPPPITVGPSAVRLATSGHSLVTGRAEAARLFEPRDRP